MKILWLYKHIPHRQYIHWFHTDFAKVLGQQKNVELKMYGWLLHQSSDLRGQLIQHYNHKKSMEDLKKKFDYDVIIIDCYNRLFRNRHESNTWLPNDFSNFNKTPKILIEGDYHNIKFPKKIYDMNIDLILHRHISNTIKANGELTNIKNLWLPCSVDNTIFKPNPDIKRKNLIYSVGAMKWDPYIYRRLAKKRLEEKGLIKLSIKTKTGQNYPKCLQSYVGYLNGSTTENITAGKMFEVMASGGVLLTDKAKSYGLRQLFYKDTYCTYKRDGSDVVKKARMIINEPTYREHLTSRALKCIQARHTHERRAKQLLRIIRKEFNL